jgi:hypothetical protein
MIQSSIHRLGSKKAEGCFGVSLQGKSRIAVCFNGNAGSFRERFCFEKENYGDPIVQQLLTGVDRTANHSFRSEGSNSFDGHPLLLHSSSNSPPPQFLVAGPALSTTIGRLVRSVARLADRFGFSEDFRRVPGRSNSRFCGGEYTR